MPGGRKSIWIQGEEYDLPDEQYDGLMKQLNRDKIDFSTDPPGYDPAVEGNMVVGEPEVIKTQHGASGEWGRDEDMGFMDRFARGAKGYAEDFGRAGEGLVRGLNQSLYQGGADEVAAAARAAGGEDFGSALKGEQAARDKAWEDTPVTYGAGRALGYVPGMLVGGPVGQGIKSVLGRIGTNVGMSAINGFLSDDGDVESRTRAAGRDALVAAPFSAAGEAMTKLGPAVDETGIALRRANAGGSQGELNATRLNQGLEHMQTGIDEDFADLGLASSIRPQSAYGVAKKLGTDETPGMIQRGGQQMGNAIDAAGEAGVRGDWDSVRQSMDNSKRAAMRGNNEPTVSQRGFASEMDRIAEQELPPHRQIQYADDFALNEPTPAVKQMTGEYLPGGAVDPRQAPNARDMAAPPQSYDYVPPTREMAAPPAAQEDFLAPQPGYNPNLATPRELQTKKNAFEAEGYPREGFVTPNSDAPRADAYRAAAGANRAELQDAMQSQSFNDYYPDFKQGRDTIAKAQPIADMAGTRAAANKAGSSVFNPLAMTAGLGGATAGLYGGGIPGAIAGGVMGFGANALARNYGQDLAGMGARGLGQGMQMAGQGMQNAGRLAGPVSGIAGATPPSPGVTAPGAGGPVDQQSSNGVPNGTRGYMTPDVVRQMLQQNPMAFGPYTQQFQGAMQDPDPAALVRLLDRLETTDDNWSRNYLKQIHQQTAGGNGF